jgi:hypothetical protein
MEVLQCYNPHKTERFCTIGVLQRCYVRHEAATMTARQENQLTEPCVSPQVFYGSRRGDGLRPRVWSLPDNGATLAVSTRGSD